ncbi:MAG: Methyltransferase type 11 [Myxococcales bacterium]|nr:Methyltransferase type 11 [Myxococcales bacterium]
MQRRPNREYYDEFAAGYEKRRHHGYHALIDRLEIAALLPFADGARVLEAGCGTGMILKEIAPIAATAVGLDLSPGMLAQARARGLQVVHGSVTDLPFGDGDFDLAYSFKVLAHVEKIERALAEMARVVRPGGHVVAEFYNPWSLRGLIKRLKPPTKISSSTTDAAVYTRYDSLPSIRRHLPANLDIIDVRGVRVVTPFSSVHDVPLLGQAFAAAETHAASAPLFRHLGGFMVITAQKR